MSGCFASGFGLCGTNRLRRTSLARFFSMCGARLASLKADRPFPLGSWRLRDSRLCLRSAAGRTLNWTTRPPMRSRILPMIRKCLTALSPEQREIVDLVYYHEKSVEEVAEIVSIPENTVKTRLFYARKKLAELLKAAGVERGWP